jgi:hypothetical protein
LKQGSPGCEEGCGKRSEHGGFTHEYPQIHQAFTKFCEANGWERPGKALFFWFPDFRYSFFDLRMPMANPQDLIFKASAMRKHRALAKGERNHDPTI